MDTYATITQLQARFDSRLIAQLSNDTNATGTGSQVDGNVQACLDDAAGDIRAAAMVGLIYSTADLSTLLASSDPLLIRLNCALGMGYLAARRGITLEDGIQKQVDAANDTLEKLRHGSRVFSINAGTAPQIAVLNATQEANLQRPSDNAFFGGASGTNTISGTTT